MMFWLFIFIVGAPCLLKANTVKFLLVTQTGQEEFVDWFEDALRHVQDNIKGLTFDSHVVVISNQYKDEDKNKICHSFENGVNFIIDVTWAGNEVAEDISASLYVPYIKLDLSINPILEFLDDYLNMRKSSDIVILVEDPKYVDQIIHHWLNSTERQSKLIISFDQLEDLKYLNPSPDNFIILANTEEMIKIMQTLKHKWMFLKFPERWNLVFLDKSPETPPEEFNYSKMNLFSLNNKFCCNLLNQWKECDNNCPNYFILQKSFLSVTIEYIAKTLTKMSSNGHQVTNNDLSCSSNQNDDSILESFNDDFDRVLADNQYIQKSKDVYRLNISATVQRGNGDTMTTIAKYRNNKLVVEEGNYIKPLKAFYRVGIVDWLPWSFQEIDTQTGKSHWTGFCIDLIQNISQLMNFDYELVVPKKGSFGKKDSLGEWDGLVGELIRRNIDIAAAPMIMRGDWEEVIDFIPPYIAETGISIIMRKPIKETSLFAFVTVLKLEVWLGILGVLISTALMIWLIDKYSPYSATNKKEIYNYNCREFSLIESFWLVLMSFTPQGGGEPPKSISSRIMVTAYWLFAALMLTTFTANLAAFLTVARLQAPVQSLEQLARQTRINYTVVQGSHTHEYFLNMKHAEDVLFRLWKELVLNASVNENQYSVWDYPIHEIYYSVLLAINRAKPLSNASEGFRLVNGHVDGDFAFIHDSSEIKYEISRNCNLTEVGEVFGEKPLAIAVQQGSHLIPKLSLTLEKLSVGSLLADLEEKYWNNSKRGKCDDDDSEGISIESLGGVFIATTFGLVLALFVMAGEVFLFKRETKKARIPDNIKKNVFVNREQTKVMKVHPATVTIGTAFNPTIDNQLTPKLLRSTFRSRTGFYN